MFGTARNSEHHTNTHGPFYFADNKDGATTLQDTSFNSRSGEQARQSRQYMQVSDRG